MNPLPSWIARHLDPLVGGDLRHHALLVHGPGGVGKSLFAHALAASRLCESRLPTGHACGTCAACHWIAQGGHPDLRVLMPESEEETPGQDGEETKSARRSQQIKIEVVREAIEFVQTTAHRRGDRVVILDPADALNAASGNALLKTLEEPPPGALFVLVTREPRRLPATIRSRCRRVTIPLPARDQALAWLAAEVGDRAADLLDLAGGAPLEAARMAGGDVGVREVLADVLSAPLRDLPATARAVVKNDLADAVNVFQRWVHDLLAVQWGGRPRYFADRTEVLDRLARGARRYPLLDLERALRQARRELRVALRPELVMERLLILYAHTLEP